MNKFIGVLLSLSAVAVLAPQAKASLALLPEPATPSYPPYRYDDGTANTSFTNPGDVLWLNQFNIVEGYETITSISAAFDCCGYEFTKLKRKTV